LAAERELRSQGHDALRIVLADCGFEPRTSDADAFFAASNGWAHALVEAGSGSVAFVQRYQRDITVRRDTVDYHFVSDDAPPRRPPWLLARRVVQTIRALRATVVHVDGLVFPVFVRHLRMALPRRTVILVQDHGGTDPHSRLFRSWRRRALYYLGLRAADGFLFTAREQALPWQRAGIIGPSQVIYEVPESSTDLGSWPIATGGAPLPGRPAMLWVGRLDPNKDPLTVLRAFEQAVKALPNAALTLVFGNDGLLTEVRKRVADSTLLRERVHLRGHVDRKELPALYAGAHLFVLGSHHEGSGYALIEALSFGVTPVVTDIPSFRALTQGGQMGALFPPGDADELARALVRLGGVDFGARREAIRAQFERELSWAAVGRKALRIYRLAAIAGRKPHGQ
jgi:glycosyltransferase involved in cell wall biosynthesis